MSDPIQCLRMQHINAVVNGQDRAVERFAYLYDAQFIYDMPHDEWQSCLVAFPGPVIFELYSPRDPLLNTRFGPKYEFGPNYVGVEFQVPDAAVARQAVVDQGRRILRDRKTAFHMHPGDGFGVAWEFYGMDFYAEPPFLNYDEPLKPPSYWSDEHPLGCLGLDRYSVVVPDLAGAQAFYQKFVNGTVTSEEDRPDIGARAVSVALGGTIVELLCPVGEGTISRHLATWNGGIRSTVFRVKDLKVARSYFGSKGVELVPGDAPGRLAIRPEDNAGLLFEFCE